MKDDAFNDALGLKQCLKRYFAREIIPQVLPRKVLDSNRDGIK